MQLLSVDARIYIFLNLDKFFAPQNIKNCHKKLLIIPLDQQFLGQQVFAL
jgi:hypothetical protein